FGAEDVAFSHGARLCPMTMTVRRRQCARFAKVEGQICRAWDLIDDRDDDAIFPKGSLGSGTRSCPENHGESRAARQKGRRHALLQVPGSTSGASGVGSGRWSSSICALRSAARSISVAASSGLEVDLANLRSIAAWRV